MSGGGSSKSTTSTTQQDLRVAADNGGIAVGAGATYAPVNEFPDAVADFAGETLNLLKQIATGTQETATKSLGVAETLASRQQVSPAGNAAVDIAQVGAWPLAIAAAAIAFLMRK